MSLTDDLTDTAEVLDAYNRPLYADYVRAAVDHIEHLELALSLAQEVAHDWRIDWRDFDGRILRDQMADLLQVANGSLDAKTYRLRQGWRPEDGAS